MRVDGVGAVERDEAHDTDGQDDALEDPGAQIARCYGLVVRRIGNTRAPTPITSTGEKPSEILSIFDRPGERMNLKTPPSPR